MDTLTPAHLLLAGALYLTFYAAAAASLAYLLLAAVWLCAGIFSLALNSKTPAQ